MHRFASSHSELDYAHKIVPHAFAMAKPWSTVSLSSGESVNRKNSCSTMNQLCRLANCFAEYAPPHQKDHARQP